MGFFGNKRRMTSTGESSKHVSRDPILGSRKVSWDNAGNTGHYPASLLGPNGGTVASYASTPMAFNPGTNSTARSRARQLSDVEMTISAGRRRSYQTDTTSHSIDPDARAMRVRKSDVFKSRPNLKFNEAVQYPVDGAGQLPTLKGGHAENAFIEELADQFDTRQLRSIMDTDLRRKKRRQSALESGRHRRKESNSDTIDTITRLPLALPPISTSMANGLVQHQNGESGTPVYDQFMEVKRSTSNTVVPNAITGPAEHWHDADSLHNYPVQLATRKDSGVILAGNRESFPDFAVVDRSGPTQRASVNSGLLTNAWSSLWRRASITRTKKENDVAQHRTKTLEQVNRSSPAESTTLHRVNTEIDGDTTYRNKHISNSSAVLYEDLENLPRPAPIQADPYDRDVPVDAFYDPRATPRAGSRTTHSRNFSRPTNESRQENRTIDEIAVIQTAPRNGKMFSPLLSGDAFPKPEHRSFPAPVIQYPPHHDIATVQGYSSPALAAGLMRFPDTSPTLPVFAERSTQQEQEKDLPSRALTYGDGGLSRTPPPLPTVPGGVASLGKPRLDRSVTGRSTNSIQSIDSTGSWLSKRTSEIDAVVRRSFSRNKGDRSPSTELNGLRTRPRPVSTASHLRDFVSTDSRSPSPVSDSQDTPQAAALDDDSDTDDHLASPIDNDLNDDSDYEHGIWRTGIGRTVQVVSSSGEEGRPVVMDRTELPTAGHSRQNSLETPSLRTLMAASTNGDSPLREPPRPAVVQRESFLTSVGTFYTADGFSSAASASSSSVATLRIVDQ